MLFSKRKIKNKRQEINIKAAGVFVAVFCFLFSLNASGVLAAAGINKQINYQGRLGDDTGDIVADGSYDIVFKLYTVDTAGTEVWTGTYTTANSNPILVSKGIFSVLLGSGNGNALALDFSADTYYLGVTVGADAEMAPRKRIGSVPQAYNSNNLVGDGYIKLTGAPTGTAVDQGTVYINPTSATAGQTLLGLAVGGTQKFKVDEAGNLAAAGDLAVGGGDITSAGALTLAPASGANLNVSLATTGDFAVNTNQLYVDTSTGFVGIGTATPGFKLDMVDNNAAAGGYRITNNTAGTTAQIQNKLVNDTGGIAYYGVTSSTYTAAPILSNRAFFGSNNIDTVVWTQTANNILFGTGGLQTTNERMRITSTGNVGIGTTSPSGLLHISAAGAAPMYITAGSTSIAQINFGDSANTNAGRIDFDNNGDYMRFVTMGAERVRITDAGNVGIGTTQPVYKLDVSGTVGVGTLNFTGVNMEQSFISNQIPPAMYYTGIAGADYPFLTAGNLVIQPRTDVGRDIIFANNNGSTTPTASMVIKSGGNVGIGTTAPNAKFEVVGSGITGMGRIGDGTNYVALGYDGSNSRITSTGAGQLLVNYNNGEGTYVGGGTTPGIFGVGEMGSERFIVQASGGVGVGDATPASLFTVGSGDPFQVNSSGAIVAATGITSSGAITFSGLSTAGIVTNTAGGVLGTTAFLPVANGGTGTSTAFTEGSIVFAGADGIYSQNNGNFFWDDANLRLGIGTLSPGAAIDIFGTTNALRLSYDGTNYGEISSNLNGQLVLQGSGTTEAAAIIGAGLAQDVSVKFDGETQDYYVGVDTDSVFKIGSGTDVGTAPMLLVKPTGGVEIGVSSPSALNASLYALMNTDDVGSDTPYAGYFYNNANNVTQDGTAKYGVYIASQGAFTGLTGATTNNYGLYVANISGADNNYSAYFGNGNVGMGALNPDAKLTITAVNVTSNQLRLRSANVDLYAGDLVGGIDFSSNDLNITTPLSVTASIQALASGTHNAVSGLSTDLVFSTTNALDPMAEVMRITKEGYVGVGSSAPTSVLFISRDTDNSVTSVADALVGGEHRIVLKNNNGTLNDKTAMAMEITESGIGQARGGMVLTRSGDGTAHPTLSFVTDPSNGAPLERMTINPNGNVGIGTNSPGNKLSLDSTLASDGMRIGVTGGILTRPHLELQKANTGQTWSIVAGASDYLRIKPATSDVDSTDADAVISVAPSGNVGIGDTTPAALLTVGNGDLFQVNSSGAIAGSKLSLLTNSDSDSEVLRIEAKPVTDLGYSPQNQVVFYSPTITTSTYNAAKIYSTFDGNGYVYGRLTLASPTGVGTWTDVLSVKNGNVGVGTTSPLTRFHTVGATASSATDFIGLFSETGVTPEATTGLTTALAQKAAVVQGDGGAYFVGRDVTNDIEFIFGTSIAGSAFAGATTNHDFQLRTNNVDRVTIKSTTGNVGVGDASPAALFTVGNGDLFQVSSTGAVTTSGGIVSLNTNSNFAVNVATGTSTGAVTIGGNANTVAIDSSDWNITATGVMSGISGITNIGAIASTTGNISLNNNSTTYTINLGTGTTTGAITLGGTGTQTISVGNGAGIKTVNLGSATTTSTTTLLSGSGGLNLNVNNSQPTNIATGTSAGAISIGGGSNTVAVNSSSWDISTAGVLSGATGITSSGTINFSGLTASSLVFTDASSNLVSSAASSAVASSITDETGTGLLVFDTSPNLTTPTASSITVTALNVNGTVYSNAGVLTNTNPSDIRLKENIRPFENVLDKIALLEPVTFDWISNGEASRGFIAQEVEKVFPELVGNNGEYKGLYTTDFIPYLVKGIQEQQTQIVDSAVQLGDLNLKTNQNITTLEELQSSIDTQLGAVSKNINTINVSLADGQASLDDYGARLGIQENLMVSLQAQVAELQILASQDLNVAQIADSAASISLISDLLGLDRVDRTVNPGDIDIVGKLSAEKIEAVELVGNVTGDVIGDLTGNVIGNLTGNVTGNVVSDTVETKQLVINVDKKDSPDQTIGTGVILSDEDAVSIKSEAVTDDSKIYITPIGSTDNQVVYVGNIEKGKGFEVKVDRIDGIKKKDINFNWWIVGSKDGGE